MHTQFVSNTVIFVKLLYFTMSIPVVSSLWYCVHLVCAGWNGDIVRVLRYCLPGKVVHQDKYSMYVCMTIRIMIPYSGKFSQGLYFMMSAI